MNSTWRLSRGIPDAFAQAVGEHAERQVPWKLLKSILGAELLHSEEMTMPPLPFTALILVGGLGTRLREVVSDIPKPMAMVGDVPFLQILIDSLSSKGVRNFVLLTGYKGNVIEDYFSNRYRDEFDIRVSAEEEPLGTGGAVKNAEQFCTEPSLLVNGDTFFDADLELLFQFHQEKRSSVTLSLFTVDDVSRYGSVIVDKTGLITGFYEKNDGPRGVGVINAGLTLLSREFVRNLPVGRSFSMERDIYPSFAQSEKMFGLAQDRPFFDIGTPESYDAFRTFYEGRRK
jgi:D-glycero-alpha-D-manno-heptose 1-phosphate guanylyltransferase